MNELNVQVVRKEVENFSNILRECKWPSPVSSLEIFFFFSIILIYISQTEIYINTLKNHTSIIRQNNKTYTILDPTLKHVIVRLHSSVTHMRIIFKRDLFIQCSLLYKRHCTENEVFN